MCILSLPEHKLSDTQPQRVQPALARPSQGRGPRASMPPTAAPAKSKGLGGLVRRYNARRMSWGELLSLSVLGCLGVLGPLGYGIWQGQVVQAERGIVAAQAASQNWYWLALAGLGVFGLLVIVRLMARRGFVAVHENGLALRQTWGPVRRLAGPRSLGLPASRTSSTSWAGGRASATGRN